MIVRLLIFISLGVLLWFWWRWSRTDQPEVRRKMILNAVFWGLIIVIAGLAATGRIHWLGAAFAGILVAIKHIGILALRFFPMLAQIYGRKRASQPGNSPPSSSTMSESEARQILEVGADADVDEIKRAHRKQMRNQHPDHGGNTYFAAKLNQARDILIANAKNKKTG